MGSVYYQILKTDHRYNIAMQICQRIDRFKKHQKQQKVVSDGDDDIPDKEITTDHTTDKASPHSLCSTSKDPRTFAELEEAFHDPAYNSFHLHLGHFMTGFLN